MEIGWKTAPHDRPANGKIAVSMVYHGVPWYTMVNHGNPWYTMVYTMVYHGVTVS